MLTDAQIDRMLEGLPDDPDKLPKSVFEKKQKAVSRDKRNVTHSRFITAFNRIIYDKGGGLKMDKVDTAVSNFKSDEDRPRMTTRREVAIFTKNATNCNFGDDELYIQLFLYMENSTPLPVTSSSEKITDIFNYLNKKL